MGFYGSEHSAEIVDVASEIAKGMTLKILLVCLMKARLEEHEGLVAYLKVKEYLGRSFKKYETSPRFGINSTYSKY